MTPKKPEATKSTTQPQPVAPAPTEAPAPAPAAAAVAVQPSKQQQKLEELKVAWVKRNVDISKLETKVDGKFLNVNVGEGWPLIVIGPTGGINLPQIRSYSNALDAAINGDTTWARQQERDAKKAAPVVAKITAHVTPAAQPEQAKAVTPTQKKTKAHEAIESRMA
jgi:hypothetical protein